MIYSKSDENSALKAAECLKKGGLAILPTDTVYGFSGIYDKGVEAKIRSVKGRDENKPFILLISNPNDVFKYTDEKIPDEIFCLWPGALTIILKTKNTSTAFRCPCDKWISDVISLCGSPIFSTSVNRSGFPALTKIDKIVSEFEKEVDLIVDDGDKNSAKPSTIISLENGKVKVVRQGDLIVRQD